MGISWWVGWCASERPKWVIKRSPPEMAIEGSREGGEEYPYRFRQAALAGQGHSTPVPSHPRPSTHLGALQLSSCSLVAVRGQKGLQQAPRQERSHAAAPAGAWLLAGAAAVLRGVCRRGHRRIGMRCRRLRQRAGWV